MSGFVVESAKMRLKLGVKAGEVCLAEVEARQRRDVASSLNLALKLDKALG